MWGKIQKTNTISNGMIDTHSHIVFGMDDGARNKRDTRKMLEHAYADGIRAIIATPHYRLERWNFQTEGFRSALEETRAIASEISPDLRIYPGNEIYYRDEIPFLLREKKIFTLAGSRYVLVEFHPSQPAAYIRQALQRLQMEGYLVILAHVERYTELTGDFDSLENLTELGIYLQVNASTLLGDQGRSLQKLTKKLLKKGMITLVASDSHDVRRRPPELAECFHYIRKKAGFSMAEKLCKVHPMKIIKNEMI